MRRELLPLAFLSVWATRASAQSPDGQAPSAAAPPGWLADLIPGWMRNAAFLIEHWQWLGLLVLVALAVILDRLVANFARRGVRRAIEFAEKLNAQVSDVARAKLMKNAGKPFGFMAGVGLAALLIPLLALPDDADGFATGVLHVLLAIGFVWAAYRLVDVAVLFLAGLAAKTDTKLDDMLVPLVRRIAKIFVVAIGAIFVAQNQGFEVGSLLAGLGIGGLAFALAAKDTVANLFGSITVLTDHPFEIGDWVVVKGVEGTVESVGFRSTRIRTFYDSLVTVPNGTLINSVVDNYGQRRHRRYSTKFGIAYDTPVWKVEAFCEGLRELVRRHPRMRKESWHIYFNDLGDNALLVMIYVFFTVANWSEELQARHEFLAGCLGVAEGLGVEYAFPTQTLHVASLPPVSADAPTTAAPLDGPDAPADLAGVQQVGRDIAAKILPG